jgi:hypothetical protein
MRLFFERFLRALKQALTDHKTGVAVLVTWNTLIKRRIPLLVPTPHQITV